jgi:pimeloyl-ACP methyl ester carboxylesterase
MVNLSELARLQAAVYRPAAGEFDALIDNGSVYVGVINQPDRKILAFRGSVTLTDWLHDFEAIPMTRPLVGTVHTGMWAGVEDIFERLDLRAGDVVSIVGHSLGCAHGAFTARLCLLRGIRVEQLYLLAPPRMGYSDFIAGLHNVGDLRAWHNAIDPVPEVPIATDDMPWAQFDLIKFVETPGGVDDLIPTKYHAIGLYVKGIADEHFGHQGGD